MITVYGITSFIFAFGMLVYWCCAFFILYHLIRFGVSGQPKKIAVIFMAGSLLLTMITTLLFANVDFESLLQMKNVTPLYL